MFEKDYSSDMVFLAMTYSLLRYAFGFQKKGSSLFVTLVLTLIPLFRVPQQFKLPKQLSPILKPTDNNSETISQMNQMSLKGLNETSITPLALGDSRIVFV